jgi:hypothetical protein
MRGGDKVGINLSMEPWLLPAACLAPDWRLGSKASAGVTLGREENL